MKISVYITSYNQKMYLKEAIDSVINQTYRPFEILIIDDASTDGSQELINSYKTTYPDLIKCYFNPTNIGITKSRNKALSLLNGDFITSLDGDDAYLPRKLEVQKKIIEDTDADLVYTNFFYAVNSLDNLSKIWAWDKEDLPGQTQIHNNVIARDFPRETLFRCELFRSSILDECGGFDENLEIYEDYEFRIRLTKTCKTTFTIEPLVIYRIHSKGLSRKPRHLHLSSLEYIFSKHKSAIEHLPNNMAKKMRAFRNRQSSMQFDINQKHQKKRLNMKIKIFLNSLFKSI